MSAPFSIDPARVQRDLEELSRIGATPDGGVSRLAFSEEERAAREWMRERMEEGGMRTRTDPAGNLFGRLDGARSDAPVVMMGSHLDTVPNGGLFDGALGCVGALEVAQTVRRLGVKLEHPLEVVVWSNEEGARFGRGLFGSRAFTSRLEVSELAAVDRAGVDLASALRTFGGSPERLHQARTDPSGVACFLELHPEQGPLLERDGVSIGVVEGIVGISRWAVTMIGATNHAGTTPMDDRKDALVAGARLAERVRREIRESEGSPVGNVGWLRAEPGVTNAVAGRATIPVELRALEQEVIEELWDRIREAAAEIAEEEGMEVAFERTGVEPPALTDPTIREAIAHAADEIGAASRPMSSGGGHDAQMLALAGVPTGLIFVPSRGGISHSPEEFTEWDDCARGVEVLYRTALAMDRR